MQFVEGKLSFRRISWKEYLGTTFQFTEFAQPMADLLAKQIFPTILTIEAKASCTKVTIEGNYENGCAHFYTNIL